MHYLVPFQFAPQFPPPSWFLLCFGYAFNDIKILGVPFGFVLFSFSFLPNVLDEDVRHVSMYMGLGDV